MGNPFLPRIIPAHERKILRTFVGRRLRVSSSGKQLIFQSEDKELILKLGMTGQFRQGPCSREHDKHHFMTMIWGQTTCAYYDFRRFSRLRECAGPAERLSLGGFCPDRGFFLRDLGEIGDELLKLPGLSSTPCISWLLRHGPRTGIGNYLANEALGRLGLSPYKVCKNEKEALTIFRMCQQLAKRSYDAGGTSFGIGYYRLDRTQGTFSQQLRFYKMAGMKRTLFRNRPVFSLHKS